MEAQVSEQEASAAKAKEEEAARVFSRDSTPPILHLLVVGFHHKKGCQVHHNCYTLYFLLKYDYLLSSYMITV